MKTLEWLGELETILQNTCCRVSGKETSQEAAFEKVAELLLNIRRNNAAIWWVGNGGSSALCSHLAQDVLNKLKIRSIALNDSALLTCMANDFGYQNVYSRPLETLAQKGDLLIAVSSSGTSSNILNCADLALSIGMSLITLSAFEETNPLWARLADAAFYLPCKMYGQVEVGHEALLHGVIETTWLNENRQNNS
jgi:D-sedoheptulose 7-phosphate isomerase